MKVRCSACGFAPGDKVRMRSALVRVEGVAPFPLVPDPLAPPTPVAFLDRDELLARYPVGETIGFVHGVIERWSSGCGHLAMWKETGCATALPNPNVELDT